jgi:hypothetical protein
MAFMDAPVVLLCYPLVELKSFMPDLRGRDNRLERGDWRRAVKRMALIETRSAALPVAWMHS